jgi:hypothetical protein
MCLGFLIGCPLYLIDNAKGKTYPQNREELINKYSNLKPGTLVGHGSIHLTYLRTDLETFDPPTTTHVTMDDFLTQIRETAAPHAVIEIGAPANMNIDDPSVASFMRQHQGQAFAVLR